MDVLKELLEIKDKLDKLSSGIDPFTGLEFPNDSILNNKNISEFFGRVSHITSHLLIETGGEIPKSIYKRRFPFYLNDSDKAKIKLSETPVSISEFTYTLNNAVNSEYMKKIRATQITHWLTQNGYLENIDINNKNYKFPTEKGKLVGISYIKKINTYGNQYAVNTYSKEAQEFILNNINYLLDENNKKLIEILNSDYKM